MGSSEITFGAENIMATTRPAVFGAFPALRKQEWLSLLTETGRQAGYFATLCPAMRRVLKSAQGPLEIPPQDKSVWICMCGLSANQPYCDGSHKRTRDEEDGKTYAYDATGHRTEIPSE